MAYKNILLTGANGDIAGAAFKILREAYPGAKVFGCDAGDPNPAAFFMDAVDKVPYASAPEYIDRLNVIVEKRGVDLVVPVTEPELLAVGPNIGRVKAPVLMNPPEVVELFLDKRRAYDWFAEHSLPMPETRDLGLAAPEELPLIVKYRASCGSKDIRVVRDPDALAYEQKYRTDSIAQRYIDSTIEYTCALIKREGKTASLIMQRDLVNGTTWKITTVENAAVTRLLDNIAALLPDCTVNVQLRMDGACPWVFEINPRFSGTLLMRHMLGFEDFLWSLRGEIDYPRAVPAGKEVYRRSVEFVA